MLADNQLQTIAVEPHQSVEDFYVGRAPGVDEVVDVGCQRFVNFDSARSGFRIRDQFVPRVLVNVEGFAGHVPETRLAQCGEYFSLIFKLRHWSDLYSLGA